jgi:glycosyltransferase involved in cell wall biosynthesis
MSASSFEGRPNAVLEALASGLPLVLSNLEAHLEVLKDCPEAGVSFDPKELEGAAQKIQQLTNPYLGAQRKKLQCTAPFSRTWEETAEGYSQLFYRIRERSSE